MILRYSLPFYLIIFILLFNFSNANSQAWLNDSLLAYYPFNGNANDATGNGNNGTVYGATLISDRFGNPNSAYTFNGTTDHIYYTTTPGYKPATFPISICMWIKSNDNNGIGTFFKSDTWIDHYTGIWIQVLVSSGTLELSYGDGGTTSASQRRSKFGTTNINDNQWHFIAGVIRGPTDMDIWVDCNYDPATYGGSGGPMLYTNGDGSSGIYDVVSGTAYYEGGIDEIRYYHRELTQSDLIQIYNYPVPFDSISVSLGNDTSICGIGSINLIPIINYGNAQNYLWSNGSSNSNLNINSVGTYWVQVMGNCSIGTDTIVVFPTTSFNTEPADTICSGNNIQLIAPLSSNYSWNPSTSLSCSSCQTPSAFPLSNVIYTVNENNGGCIVVDSFPIFVLPSPQVIASGDTSLCGSAPIQLNASGAVSYTWSPSTYLSLTNISNPVANPVTTISYTVTGVDTNGCSSSDMVNILFPAPSEVDFRDTTIFCNESVILFTGTSLIGTTFHWQPSYGLSDTNSVYPVASPLTNTTYTLVVQQADGCESHYTFPVNVSAANIFLPNAFTPNNDDINDLFSIIYSCGFELKYFRIYNRWGQLVFETSDVDEGWDGTIDDRLCSMGVYAWVVVGRNTYSNSGIFLKGNVTLIR